MPPTLVAFFIIVVLAASVQTMAGFGFALVLMPLTVLLLGLRTAAPLVALLGLTVSIINAIRYRQTVDPRELGGLIVVAGVGVPLGVWLLSTIDERIVTPALGIVLIVYALLSLLRPASRLPISRAWAYPAGFVAGCLAGAYNVPGPPLILYGALRQWPHTKFRAMLQSLFTTTYTLTIATHFAARNITGSILLLYAYAIPAFLLGIAVGALVERRLDTHHMRHLVNWLILALGVSLLF